ASNWNGGVPTSSVDGFFNLNTNCALAFNTAANVANLSVNNGTVSFSLSAQQMAATSLIVGNVSGQTGRLTMVSGSMSTTGATSIGFASGSVGNFAITGGSFSSGGDLYLGRDGAGNMVQNGGTVTIANSTFLWIGNSASATGTYSLSAGTLNVTGVEVIG